MRAHPALGGLLDVEFHQLAAGVVADRHPQPVPRRPGPAQRGHVQRGRFAHAEQRGQRGGGGERVAGRPAGHHGPQRGQLPGQCLGLQRRQRVGHADVRLGGPVPRYPVHLVRRDPQGQRRRARPGGFVPAGRAHVDEDHAVDAVQLDAGLPGRAVRHHHVQRQRPGASRGPRPAGHEPGPVAQLQHGLQGAQRRAHQPHRAGRVLLGGVYAVRQPLDPFPVRDPAGGRGYADADVGGGVRHRELGDQRTRQGPDGAGVAGRHDPGHRPQRHLDRQPGHLALGPDEPAQRPGAQRVQVLDRLGIRGTSRTARAWVPVANRTQPKPGSPGVRRQIWPAPARSCPRPWRRCR